jgi:hypothetical protein
MIETTRLKKRIISIALLGFLVVAPSSAMSAKGRVAAGILVPSGTHVLIDGKFGLGEWADARRIASLDSTAIYLKRDAKYLYVAVRPKGGAFSVDLYFDRRDTRAILDLHASAKLGEREGTFGKWPEWLWWNNRGWAANVVRVVTFEPREFLADEVKEYQIEVGRLRARHVWLSADVQKGEVTRSIPSDGAERYGRHWLGLRL